MFTVHCFWRIICAMALFQKRPTVTSSAPAYTIGGGKTYLIIGLGNPEAKYGDNRHNIGFATLDHFARQNDFPDWTEKKDLKGWLASADIAGNRVILGKPMTYMNLSGEAALAVQHFYRIYNKDTLAVYDELAIPFGQLRTRLGGTDAGHNGVKSLIEHLGEDFGRLRIGVGPLPAGKDAAAYVLQKFSQAEQAKLPLILREANAMITEFIASGDLPHDTRNIL